MRFSESTSDATSESSPLSEGEASIAHLKPRDAWGALYLSLALGFTGLAVYLSVSPRSGWWLLGQVLLSFALLQWFAVLHEAGHKTLFRTNWLNQLTGHLAGFLALIPLDCWKLVHARHHRWTGWQDLDATTATLVPRRRWWLEKLVVNVCWFLWLPLFSTTYRLSNYWHLPRLLRLFPQGRQRWRLTLNIVLYLLAYGLLAWLVGPERLLHVAGLGLFLSLVWQDPLILSQHTHIPMQVSEGKPVLPFSPREQEEFTRSLVFPTWFSRWVLLNLDAHELHHVHASVPGYFLHKLSRQTKNRMPWWQWLWRAKQIRGDVLLFQNRNETGYQI